MGDATMKNQNKGRMRQALLNVHLYLGLFCSWYLLIYGYTSLAFNHPWLLPKHEGEESRWDQQVTTPDGAADQEVANAIRDELGMVGWAPYWTLRRDSDRHLHFEVVHPGREHRMEFIPEEGLVKATQQSKGVFAIIHYLHGVTERVPNAQFPRLWAAYTEITNWFVLFAVGTGVYLWASRARNRRAGWLLLGASFVASAAIMAFAFFLG